MASFGAAMVDTGVRDEVEGGCKHGGGGNAVGGDGVGESVSRERWDVVAHPSRGPVFGGWR